MNENQQVSEPEDFVMSTVTGIHHVTCIAGDPQENVDFYTGSLGMRLVKKSVNQDVPDTYHLFYRDDLEQTRLEPLRRLHEPVALG